ncbi:hypothetical protein DIPPA_18228 [Diplonema papillatum]|nr:hypothetical protein DIPPA_18228 [Diplonema papillatum]
MRHFSALAMLAACALVDAQCSSCGSETCYVSTWSEPCFTPAAGQSGCTSFGGAWCGGAPAGARAAAQHRMLGLLVGRDLPRSDLVGALLHPGRRADRLHFRRGLVVRRRHAGYTFPHAFTPASSASPGPI